MYHKIITNGVYHGIAELREVEAKPAEKSTKPTSDDFDKLLAEARERFPAGCRYICHTGAEYTNKTPSEPFWTVVGRKMTLEKGKGLIYDEGKWVGEVVKEAARHLTKSEVSVGDTVELLREGTDAEWRGCGRVRYLKVGDQCKVKALHESLDALELYDGSNEYYYPTCIFKLVSKATIEVKTSNTMSKEELLEEARRRFPGGCKYKEIHGGIYNNYTTSNPYWWGDNSIALQEGCGLVYKKDTGEWGECLSEPVEKITKPAEFENHVGKRVVVLPSYENSVRKGEGVITEVLSGGAIFRVMLDNGKECMPYSPSQKLAQCAFVTAEKSEKSKESVVESNLDKARRLYPIGTRFRPCHVKDDGESYCIIVNQRFNESGDGYIIALTDRGDNYTSSDDSEHGNTILNRVVYANGTWSKILPIEKKTRKVVEQPDQFDGDELLAEARRRYPIGTRFHPAHLSSEDAYCIVTNGIFKKSSDGGITSITDEDQRYNSSSKYGNTVYDRYVYYNGKWATIVTESVPEPQKTEDMASVTPSGKYTMYRVDRDTAGISFLNVGDMISVAHVTGDSGRITTINGMSTGKLSIYGIPSYWDCLSPGAKTIPVPTAPSTPSRVEIVPNVYHDTVLVGLGGSCSTEGQLAVPDGTSSRGKLVIRQLNGNTHGTSWGTFPSNWRLASPYEIELYRSGVYMLEEVKTSACLIVFQELDYVVSPIYGQSRILQLSGDRTRAEIETFTGDRGYVDLKDFMMSSSSNFSDAHMRHIRDGAAKAAVTSEPRRPSSSVKYAVDTEVESFPIIDLDDSIPLVQSTIRDTRLVQID